MKFIASTLIQWPFRWSLSVVDKCWRPIFELSIKAQSCCLHLSKSLALYSFSHAVIHLPFCAVSDDIAICTLFLVWVMTVTSLWSRVQALIRIGVLNVISTTMNNDTWWLVFFYQHECLNVQLPRWPQLAIASLGPEWPKSAVYKKLSR